MKLKTIYICQQCGATAPKWTGKCSSCGSWNSFIEEVIQEENAKEKHIRTAKILDEDIVTLSQISGDEQERIVTPDSELNRVLGGGIVPGSVVLLGGEPGIGKSTILLQLGLQARKKRVLYVCGEESLIQVKLRASRLGLTSENCFFIAETTLEQVLAAIKKTEPDIVVIDSIQTIASLEIEATPGSISQIRECTASFIKVAKKDNIAVFLIGHITKEGYIAGPKILEHMVDTVLYFEGDRHYNYRLLRTMKNRFGSVSEIGIYEMSDKGLRPVLNPSEILLTLRPEPLSGVAITSMLEGNRAMLIEVQSLVSATAYSTPQRTTTGFDSKRMSMLIAILEKRCGMRMNLSDVFLNMAGGLKVDDPAVDLAVVAAMASSFNDIALPDKTCFAGEIGLSGEIRPINQVETRIAEAEKLGFTAFHLSSYSKKSITKKFKEIQLTYHDTVPLMLMKVMG